MQDSPAPSSHPLSGAGCGPPGSVPPVPQKAKGSIHNGHSRGLSQKIGEPLKYRSRPGHHLGSYLVESSQSEAGTEFLDRPPSGERDEIDQLDMLFGSEKLFPLTQIAQATVEGWFELVVGYRSQSAGTVPQNVIGHADGCHGL
jgi:hypothetical protein